MLHLLSSCRMYCFILAPLGCNQKPASSFGARVILLCSLEETNSIDFEATYQPKTDLLKALAVFAAAMTGAVAFDHSWVAANQVYLNLVSRFRLLRYIWVEKARILFSVGVVTCFSWSDRISLYRILRWRCYLELDIQGSFLKSLWLSIKVE